MISLTTDSIPARERVEFWAILVSRHVTPVGIEPAGAHEVRGEIEARVVGDLGVARVSGQGVQASQPGRTSHAPGGTSTGRVSISTARPG